MDLLLLGNSLPVTTAIAKLHVSGKSIAMAAELFASDSQLSASAFDHFPHDFNGKRLFVESIGGEVSSAANAYGEESPAADAYEEESAASYHSSASAFAQGDFHLHGFVQLISALSSEETIGHQHPLFPHCTAMHLTAMHLTACI